jgi:hypothetical protein
MSKREGYLCFLLSRLSKFSCTRHLKLYPWPTVLHSTLLKVGIKLFLEVTGFCGERRAVIPLNSFTDTIKFLKVTEFPGWGFTFRTVDCLWLLCSEEMGRGWTFYRPGKSLKRHGNNPDVRMEAPPFHIL